MLAKGFIQQRAEMRAVASKIKASTEQSTVDEKREVTHISVTEDDDETATLQQEFDPALALLRQPCAPCTDCMKLHTHVGRRGVSASGKPLVGQVVDATT